MFTTGEADYIEFFKERLQMKTLCKLSDWFYLSNAGHLCHLRSLSGKLGLQVRYSNPGFFSVLDKTTKMEG